MPYQWTPSPIVLLALLTTLNACAESGRQSAQPLPHFDFQGIALGDSVSEEGLGVCSPKGDGDIWCERYGVPVGATFVEAHHTLTDGRLSRLVLYFETGDFDAIADAYEAKLGSPSDVVDGDDAGENIEVRWWQTDAGLLRLARYNSFNQKSSASISGTWADSIRAQREASRAESIRQGL
jgi:hypothetical protein